MNDSSNILYFRIPLNIDVTGELSKMRWVKISGHTESHLKNISHAIWEPGRNDREVVADGIACVIQLLTAYAFECGIEHFLIRKLNTRQPFTYPT